MSLLLVGINHTTAHIDLREKVAFPPEIVREALEQARGLDYVEEVVIVSTCNRTELYLDCEDGANNGTEAATASGAESLQRRNRVVEWLAGYHKVSATELTESVYSFSEDDVVRHLMRVSCGLDSMVLGEPQILGQIKSAFAVSKEFKVVGSRLGKAFQEAFSIAKEVRTDTAIGENPISVAYAGVSLAERIFSRLESLNVLLIGAGRTIELVARHLSDRGVKQIVVANRTLDNAMEIASRVDGHGVLLSEIPEQLVKADIVVSSTNSQLPLLGKGAVERALKKRRHKPMLLIDLAVPRDIESEVARIPDAYLYTVDDISSVIEDSQKSREDAADQATSIIERGVEEFRKHMRSLNAVSTLKAFRQRADGVRMQELERALKALEKGDQPEAVLEQLSRGITNKLIHPPTVQMKKASAEGREELLDLTRELFDLDAEQD